MKYFRLMLAPLKSDKRAVTALEYGMIAAVVAVVAIGGFSVLGKNLSTQMSGIGATLSMVP